MGATVLRPRCGVAQTIVAEVVRLQAFDALRSLTTSATRTTGASSIRKRASTAPYEERQPMNLRTTLLLGLVLIVPTSVQAQSPVAFEQKTDRLHIQIDGKPFATYVWED